MCGVGFSGKSTLSQKISEYLHVPLVSQDGLFFEKKGELNIDEDDGEQWRMLLKMCQARIKGYLLAGESVVFDNVNLKKEHRDELKSMAEEAGAETIIIYLATPEKLLNERQERNKLTKEHHEVKQEYLDDARKQLEIPTEQETNVFVFTPETNLDIFLSRLLK